MSSGHIKASRIDYALISRGMDAKVSNITYIPATLTDHSSVVVCIEDLNKRGIGYWKMNTLYLHEEKYVHIISETIEQCMARTYEDATQRWLDIKKTITEATKKYARGRTSMDQVIISQLMEYI